MCCFIECEVGGVIDFGKVLLFVVVWWLFDFEVVVVDIVGVDIEFGGKVCY